MIRNYTLKVVSVIQETPDAVTICFKQPGLKKISYLAGQYLTLIVNVNGRRYRRPYSLSSAHGVDATLNITVKRVPHGVVSNYLCDTVKEGDIIEVNEPLGEFVYSSATSAGQLVLWGAGSGITPLYAMIKAALKTGSQNITLVYINHRPDSAIFIKELQELKLQYSERFIMYNFYTRCNDVPEDSFCYHERLSSAKISAILNETQKSGSGVHYICGPTQLKETLKETFKTFDIPPNHVFSEDFDHVVDESQLQDVHTANVKINFQHESSYLEVVRGKSILEAALDRNLDLPYSCQNGSCKLCKARLISGSVKLIGSDMHTNGLNTDERLLCCSYPLTHDVEFEVS